jgi:hypothetical protein
MMSNEEEIKDLNEGILNKFETVLTKEDEILINQVELYHSTEFVKQDIDFMLKNEQEIKDLEEGILR